MLEEAISASRASAREMEDYRQPAAELSKVVFCRIRTELYPGYLPRVIPYNARGIYRGYYPAKNFCKFCRTFIPVPRTCVSSVRHSYPYPELLEALYVRARNTRGTGTAFFMRRVSEASLFFLGFPRKKKPLHNGSYEHRVPKINTKHYSVCVCDSTSTSVHRTQRTRHQLQCRRVLRTHTYSVVLTSRTCAITWYVVQSWRRQMRKRVFLQPVTQTGPRFCDFQKFKKLITGFLFLYQVRVSA